MKKILIVALLGLSASAFAYDHGYHGYWRHNYNDPWRWVGPTLIGGVVGYEIARSQQPVIVQQQPVIVQNPSPIPTVQTQNCTPWTEVMNPNGTITRTRTCTQ